MRATAASSFSAPGVLKDSLRLTRGSQELENPLPLTSIPKNRPNTPMGPSGPLPDTRASITASPKECSASDRLSWIPVSSSSTTRSILFWAMALTSVRVCGVHLVWLLVTGKAPRDARFGVGSRHNFISSPNRGIIYLFLEPDGEVHGGLPRLEHPGGVGRCGVSAAVALPRLARELFAFDLFG